MRRRSLLAALLTAAAVLPGPAAGAVSQGWTLPQRFLEGGFISPTAIDITSRGDFAHIAFTTSDDVSQGELWYATNRNGARSMRLQYLGQIGTFGETAGDVSIGVDADGAAYIAYDVAGDAGPARIAVATNASGTWTTSTLPAVGDSGPIGAPRHPDLVLAPSGDPVVVFEGLDDDCAGRSDLYLARSTGAGWATPQNLTSGHADPQGAGTCIDHSFPALASVGSTLHLAYRYQSSLGGGEQVHYRAGALGNASDQTVDDTGASIDGWRVGEHSVDIALDAAGVPHVSFWSRDDEGGTSYTVHHAQPAGSAWQHDVVASGSRPLFRAASMAFDQGAPAVAFSRLKGQAGDALVGTQASDGTWSVANLHPGDADDRDVRIATDAQGDLHATYRRAQQIDPKGMISYIHQAPRATATFAVEGEEFTGGQEVDMSGTVRPATPGEVVRIHTQRFDTRRDEWVDLDVARVRTGDDGSFTFVHEALRPGRKYRSRSLWRDTLEHLRGGTRWDAFVVRERRAH